MKEGETRNFEIDRTKKPDCGLKKEITEITIKKTILKIFEETIFFKVVGYEKIAYIDCTSGYIKKLNTKGETEGCGIGKILTKLCIYEKDIHNVENNKENEAMKAIQSWLEECKNMESCNGKDHQKQLMKMEKWASSDCQKMIHLLMDAKPRKGAHVYFNSFAESGFDQMFIKIDHNEMYPQDGHCSVKTLQQKYNEQGEMVDGDNNVDVGNRFWFFCLPTASAKETDSPAL